MIVEKNFFKEIKPKLTFENLTFPQRDFVLLVKRTLKYA